MIITRPRFMLHCLAVLLCTFAVLQSACSSTPISSGGQSTPVSGTASPASSQSTPVQSTTATTVQMPQTQTACPDANTARAAIMRSLVLGKHQNLVYIYNDVPQNTSIAFGNLRRYDMTTGQKVNLATNGLQILQAQVSNDGQWVLFLSQPDPRGGSSVVMLQLVCIRPHSTPGQTFRVMAAHTPFRKLIRQPILRVY